MTRGGLTAKQMAAIRHRETLEARANTAMLYRAAGFLTYGQNLAADSARRRSRRKAA